MRPPEPWDINAGHTRNIQFTTDEGTWYAKSPRAFRVFFRLILSTLIFAHRLNVDVSPDGSTILFDMLGDLYTLPMTGGAATLLRGGVSFDTQPRYNPAGNLVLFTSDISGCDNIHVMDATTKQAWPVTTENYHFVRYETLFR